MLTNGNWKTNIWKHLLFQINYIYCYCHCRNPSHLGYQCFKGKVTSYSTCFVYLFFFKIKHFLSVLRGHSVLFIPATTANDLRLRRIFYPRCYPSHLFSYLNSWERASIFPFECSVLNKGTTGTIFITSLVWPGPWLGIEPGTSRSRSQHWTTRLSRRR